MANKTNKENSKTSKNKGTRGKSKVQLKLDKLKEVLKKGTKEHIDAIDLVIQQYEDYKNVDALVQNLEEMKARVEAAQTTKANEAERKKAAEEAAKIKEEEKKAKKKEKNK